MVHLTWVDRRNDQHADKIESVIRDALGNQFGRVSFSEMSPVEKLAREQPPSYPDFLIEVSKGINPIEVKAIVDQAIADYKP